MNFFFNFNIEAFMMKRNRYKGICVMDSVYTFFLFVLINIKDYKEFFYIFWVNMPVSISDKMPYKLLLHDPFVPISDPHNYISNWRYKLRFYWIMTKFRLWGLPACGQDHLPFSRYILNYTNKTFEEYEDGLENYHHKEEIIYDKFRKRICAADVEPRFGTSKKVRRIYLTDSAVPFSNQNYMKAQYVDIKKEWDGLSEEEKGEIMKIFCMSNVNIAENIDTIVLTRPYSEDRICTEDEKINKLKKIIEGKNINNVVIKPHYRERTDYKIEFPEINVIDRNFPVELYLLVNGSKIKKFITYGKCSAEHFVRRYYPEIEYIRME